MKRALLTYGTLPIVECWMENGKVLEADIIPLLAMQYTNTCFYDALQNICYNEIPPQELTIWYKD